MHPFNTFPYLLSFSFFVPIIFRMSCVIAFGILAIHHYREHKHIEALVSPLVGKHSKWIIQLLVLVEAIVAMMLFVGWYTQIAAILASALALKLSVIRPLSISPFGRMNAFLLLVMSLSLIITGAGAFAFDIPL